MPNSGPQLKFWGVRGSTPTPQIENLTFGGNTSCVEIRTAANEGIIFDAGSGIRNLGQTLLAEAAGALNLKLFLTHFHWDHIQGIPFFPPIYAPQNRISFYTGVEGRTLEETLEGQMAKPYFPVDFGQVAAARDFHVIEAGSTVQAAPAVTIIPFPLNHPQNASGYRIEVDGKVVVYATDYEHGHVQLDKTLRDYAAGADALICDAQYTPAEYEKHRGWGHSTWLNAASVARDAAVGQLFLFHHDPSHSDQQMMSITAEARREFENTTAAWEGLLVNL